MSKTRKRNQVRNTDTLQEVKKEVVTINPQPQKTSNPYRIVGSARVSKTGASLSIKLNDNPTPRYITISKSDLIAIFTNPNENSVAYVREYDNPPLQNKDV
jgi:hypothetical protein